MRTAAGPAMATNGPSEISIVRQIVRQLNMIPDAYARKCYGGAYSGGWPDIIAHVPGVGMLALEVKRPGGKPTPLQSAELAKWRKAGAISGVVTSWSEVKQMLDEFRYPL